MLAILYQGSSFLQMFVDSCDEEGCEDTALNWVIAAVIVAVVCALIMVAFKWLRKYTAINIVQKAWSRGQTIVLIIVGLMPAVLMLITVWYVNRNFFNYVGIGGLLKGILMSWLLYVLFMFAGHVLSPWRREIL
jgi:uncharacterized oligopeptide transporter (OPT) family protein